MLRSLWSGVSGLKSEQEAMDVVGNNVANVNTIGFKKGRITFVDVLSQTMSAATGPEGNIGGKNATQIGLGDTVAVVDNIFSQGSLQATSKTTDLAIQGDGFFIVSDDGGKTYRYTRAGDFSFDAAGNLVNPEGFIVQGWMANDETHKINTAASIENIVIPQDKTVPAGITKNITIKANLNGGDHIEEMAPAHGTVDENGNQVTPDDMAVLFDVNGDAINLGKELAQYIHTNSSFSSDCSNNCVYDLSGHKIQLASGTVVKLQINNSYVSLTYTTTPTNDPNKFTSFGGFVNKLKTQIDNIAGNNVNVYTTNTGAILISNATNTPLQIGVVSTTAGDFNGYFKSALINLEDSQHGQSIGSNATRSTLPFLAAPGDILAMSYDNGETYHGYIYTNNTPHASQGTFRTIQDLVNAINYDLQQKYGNNAKASIDPKTGEIVIENDTNNDIRIGKVFSNNLKLGTIMGTLSGLINPNGKVSSQPFEAAVHVTSIDVYDSLGNKHTVTFTFRKTGYDTSGYAIWSWEASVPKPGQVSNNSGIIKFDQNGRLVYLSSPVAITVDWRNGTQPQVINLNFGDINTFDGLTQFSLPSQTTAETQDGYPGGSLQRVMINQDGVIIGIFSNGKSYPLAQIALAKFANNEGLMKEGNSMYAETANSGHPVIGTAGTGGRGTFAPSHLEMSNVDLAEEFTNMIIYERAFQANSRSITTSDQMIQELLNLKR